MLCYVLPDRSRPAPNGSTSQIPGSGSSLSPGIQPAWREARNVKLAIGLSYGAEVDLSDNQCNSARPAMASMGGVWRRR